MHFLHQLCIGFHCCWAAHWLAEMWNVAFSMWVLYTNCFLWSLYFHPSYQHEVAWSGLLHSHKSTQQSCKTNENLGGLSQNKFSCNRLVPLKMSFWHFASLPTGWGDADRISPLPKISPRNIFKIYSTGLFTAQQIYGCCNPALGHDISPQEWNAEPSTSWYALLREGFVRQGSLQNFKMFSNCVKIS